jgi:hypothetical protein
MQGWDEIMRLKDLLEAIPGFSARHQVLPLHSMVPAADQRRVFLRPPAGVRKVTCGAIGSLTPSRTLFLALAATEPTTALLIPTHQIQIANDDLLLLPMLSLNSCVLQHHT